MKVSFVVPTLNEEGNVTQIYNTINDGCSEKIEWELIFVDDNSSDGTVPAITALNDRRITLIKSPVRLGLGHALNQGWSAAKLDHVCFLDCDSKVPKEQVMHLLELANRNVMVIGSRFKPEAKIIGVSKLKVLGSKILNKILARFIGSNASDLSHSLRIFPNVPIRINEVLSHPGYMWFHSIKFVEKGFKIVEHPITFIERDTGRTKNTLSKLMRSLMEFLLALIKYDQNNNEQ